MAKQPTRDGPQTMDRRKLLAGLVVAVVGATAGAFANQLPKLAETVVNKVTGRKNLIRIGFDGIAYAIQPDIVVDGIDDHVQVQQAIDALPSTGGKVIIYGGNYDFGATVSRAIDNIVIEGSGKATYLANNGSTNLITAGSQTGWIVKDLRTDAGGLGGTWGTANIRKSVWVNITYYNDSPILATSSGLTVSATDKLLGRVSAGAGDVEEITCTAAGRAILDDATAADQRTTLGLGTMATETATDYVAKSLFDANTVLAANSDNTPAALTVAEQRVVGRKTGGSIDDLTGAEAMGIVGAIDTGLADHAYWGIFLTGTAGENVAINEVCYLKAADSKWWKAKADASSTSDGILVMATAAINADASGVFLAWGFIRNDDGFGGAMTVNAPQYLSGATAGAITGTAPSTSGHYVRRLGAAYAARILKFSPSEDVFKRT
jgi:hypothetical protein